MPPVLAAKTAFTREAERLVRDPQQFKWYAVSLLALVIYAYAVEVERGRFDVIAAGLAVWLADWFNEIVNSLVLHSSGRAPLWATTGPTAYQFLVGLNVEISFMFALGGIVYAKLLPERGGRFAIALGLSVVSVAVEVFLRAAGVFHWHYWWWNVETSGDRCHTGRHADREQRRVGSSEADGHSPGCKVAPGRRASWWRSHPAEAS